MARLPSYLDLSGPENMRSGRAIAQVDTSAIGRGLAAGAGEISSVASQLAAKQKDQQNVVDIARAEAEKTKGLLETQNQFDHDPEYATFGKRAPAATSDVVKKAGDLIRDPNMREKWLAQSGSDVARTNDSIFDWGRNKQRDAETTAFDDALEANRRIYVDPNTPDAVRAKAKKDIEGSIQAGQQAGLLDPNAAAARRKTYIEDAEFSRGKLAVDKDPSVISKPLPANVADRASTAVGYFQSQGWTKEQAAGIVGNLMAESTLNTGARNGGDGSDGTDSIGIGQWNSDRARSLKAFAEQNHTDWKDFGTQLAFVQHELTHGEGNAASLLKNAKDVKSATEAMIMYERPAGSDKGPQNAISYKKRLQYAAQAAGQDVNPDWYKAISPEQRAVIDNEVDTRNNQLAVESRANIEVATTNGPQAVLNAGSYSGSMPSADDFFQAYGPQEGASRYNNFVSSMQTSQQAYSMRTMSADDIQTMVNQAKPTGTGDTAALETARYQTLSNAAETTLKSREADPATYVRQAFPSVNQQWHDAKNVGNYQSAVAASIAAQQQLGIQNIQPLPKEIAANAVASFKNETIPQQDRIQAVGAVLMATPDKGQRQALFNQLVDAGLPDMTEGAFEALSRGDAGAAQRLFQAAMIDPTKLPGKLPDDQSPAKIDEAVQDKIMDQGQIGDIYYGLSDGTAENFIQAQRDSKLINNAVNVRLRNGETMDAAIAGVSKDLYGDVVPVTDTNVQILVPKGDDAGAVVDGLHAAMPDVEAALTAALAPPKAGDWPSQQQVAGLKLTPQEQHLYQHHIDNLNNRKFVRNDDGSVSTVYQTSVDIKGRTYNFPTVWDGKLLDTHAAVERSIKDGGLDSWPSYPSVDAAESRYQTMHTVMDGDIAALDNQSSGNNAIITAVAKDSISRVMNEGYFRNSGEGFVFIDPYTGRAVADPQGNPVIFKPNMAVPRPAPNNPLKGGPQPFMAPASSPVSGIVPKGIESLGQ